MNENMTHTPGPWIIEKTPRDFGAMGIWAGEPGTRNREVCNLHHDARRSLPITERNANAMLIAAAPDLLLAAESICETWESHGCFRMDDFAALRGAVNKATGKWLVGEQKDVRPKWISVCERLPEDFATVLVSANGRVFAATIRRGHCHPMDDGKLPPPEPRWRPAVSDPVPLATYSDIPNVTHWMPLPVAPVPS